MANTDNSYLERLLSSILGRVILVILTSMVSAGALLLLFWANLYIPPFLVAGIVLTGIGLISGIAARWFLRRNTAALKLLAGLTGLSFSLALIGVITEGAIGLSLTPKGLSGLGGPDWRGLLQIAWSGLMTWLILWAWRKPIRIKEPAPRTARTRLKRRSTPKVVTPKSERKSPLDSISKRIPRPTMKVGTKKKRSPVKVTQAKKSRRIGMPNLRLKRSPEVVRLVGKEEHHCPYCLEIVEKGDARGVKVCSICRTWHHADCWAVTDACQVPHEH